MIGNFAAISVSTADVLDGKMPVIETKSVKQGQGDPAEASRTSRLRPWLAGDAPGLWASNHLEESQHIVGWNYCAIRGKAESVAACKVQVFRIHESYDRGLKCFRKSQRPVARDLREAGTELAFLSSCPDYNHLFFHPDTGHAWFVVGDGSEREDADRAQRVLSHHRGVSQVTIEAEAYPPKGAGWIRVTPSMRQWNKRSDRGGGRINKTRADVYRDDVTGDEWDEDDGQQKKLLPEQHPFVRFLKKPNPGQAWAEFIFQVSQQKNSTGTGYVWTLYNEFGVPREAYCIPTGLMTPLPPSVQYPHGRYRVAPLASYAGPLEDDFQSPGVLGSLLIAGAIIDARAITPIRWPHPTFLSDGLSPLSATSMFTDVAEQLDRARWYSLKNEQKPGIFYEQDPSINPSQEEMDAFIKDVNQKKGGTTHIGENMLLPRGVKAGRQDRPPSDLDYGTGWTQARDSVLATHRTPPVAIGISPAASYAAYYVAMKQYTDQCVQPEADQIAAKLTEAWAPGFARGNQNHGFEIKLIAKAIDDPTYEQQRRNRLVQQKCITKDEERAMEGLPPMENGRGQVLCGDPDPQAQQQPGAPGAAGAPGAGQPAATDADVAEVAAALGGGGDPGAGGKGGDDMNDVLAALGGGKNVGDGGGVTSGKKPSMGGMTKSVGPHKYATTQFDIGGDVAARIKAFGESIPDSDLAEEGRESDVHLTVLYGLLSGESHLANGNGRVHA